MTPEEFRRSSARDAAPAKGMSVALQALWHDARGDWDAAHDCAQAAAGRDGDWVHAYLHRKEGDPGNAGYWYAKARRAMPVAAVALETEWADIARELLAR